MPQISPQHIQPLTAGFATLLVLALFGIMALNHVANR